MLFRSQVKAKTMAGEEGKGSGIEKFDGADFAYWRMQIEDYLYGKKLHLPLLGMKPDTMKDEEHNLLTDRYWSYLINFVKISCIQCCEGKYHSGSNEGFVWHI